MPVITVKGVVENGQVKLSEDVALPEHAEVYVVVVPDPQPRRIFRIPSVRLVNREDAKYFEKTVTDLPPDAEIR